MAAPRNSQRARTVQEMNTSLSPAEVLNQAKNFFSRQNGVYAAFLEQEGPTYITLRGQGGEEIVIGLAQDVFVANLSVEVRVFERVVNQKGAVDPEVAAIPIFHPREHVFQTIEKLGQIK